MRPDILEQRDIEVYLTYEYLYRHYIRMSEPNARQKTYQYIEDRFCLQKSGVNKILKRMQKNRPRYSISEFITRNQTLINTTSIINELLEDNTRKQ